MDTVVIQKVDTYDKTKIMLAFHEAFHHLGGISKFIQKGDRVLLKVNMLMKKSPEEATTTHPIFVEALAQILVDYGAHVMIGDSPGGPFSKARLKAMYEACGFSEAAEKTGATLLYDTSFQTVSLKEDFVLKQLTLISAVFDADKVISLSKMKSHQMMKFTGAVKNLFGTVPGTVKAEYHFNRPSLDDFADALIDICRFVHPVLSFMDGIVGMDGHGPSAGNPKSIGLILSSASPFALDYTAAQILNTPPESIPTVKQALSRGLFSPEQIDLKGISISQVKVLDFAFPQIQNAAFIQIKNPLFRFVHRLLLSAKPQFDKNACIRCGDCMKNCPPKAITMPNKGYPKVDLSLCIRCYCCQELCPKKAVKVKKPFLMKGLEKF